MKLFLFDLDGTLLTTDGAGRAALKLASADVLGVDEDLNDIVVSGNTDSNICREILAKHRLPFAESTLNQLLGAYLARLVDQLKVKPGRVLPGVVALLEFIGRTTAAKGLLTGNLRRGADLKLRTHNLSRYFDFGAFGDDSFDRNNLGPIALGRAQARYKTRIVPADTYVIGDTPRDVACARAFDAKAVAVATGYYSMEELAETQPDFLWPDLSDLPEVRRQLGLLANEQEAVAPMPDHAGR
ncbi:MAG: HAD hydrolase-like protein [Verrucomicrobia bacterium]|nr:HAD hydrolase-like protein [Verrucomicrobiota bacterium]